MVSSVPGDIFMPSKYTSGYVLLGKINRRMPGAMETARFILVELKRAVGKLSTYSIALTPMRLWFGGLKM